MNAKYLAIVVVFIGLMGFLIYKSPRIVEEPTPINNIPENNNPDENPSETELFSDFEGNTTLEYDPLVFTVNPVNDRPTKNWALNAEADGLLLANLTLQKSYMPGTNFSNAHFTFGRSEDPKAVQTCEPKDLEDRTPEESEIISGYLFEKLTFSDAGAGNFYDTTSYHKAVGVNCYIIEYTIHSTNISNYPPEMGIREFDKSKVQNELESLVESFHFGI